MEEKRGFSSAVKGASKPCLGKIKTSEEQKYAHPGYGNVTVYVTCASFYTAVVVPVLLTPVSLMETNPEEKSSQQKGALLKGWAAQYMFFCSPD